MLLTKIYSHINGISIRLTSIVMVGIFLAGCLGNGQQGSDVITMNDMPMSWDLNQEDELLAYTKVQIKTYADEGYTEITNGGTASAVSSDPMRIWINSDQAQAYRDLNESSSFPIGTTIIRALYDSQGNVKKITAVVKGIEGANPGSNDWMFAVSDHNGVLDSNTTGQLQFGALANCNVCHIQKLDTAGLFGLAAQ